MIRWGSTQGRLVEPWTGQLQCFPQYAWKRELRVAKRIGLQYVEWLVERQHNSANPLWSTAGRAEIRDEMAEACLEFRTLINDYIIDHPLQADSEPLAQSLRLVEVGAELGLRRVVVPLFEASDPAVVATASLTAALKTLAGAAEAAGIEICLETLLPGRDMIDLVNRIGSETVKICFDTGNRAAAGHHLAEDIRLLGGRITEIHVKDKNADGTNVLLGAGLVDFPEVANALAAIKFDGDCTLETPRGRDPEVTGAYHRAFFHFCLSEAGCSAGQEETK